MKRIISAWLIIFFFAACQGTAEAESSTVFTYHNAAKTQIKSQTHYEDGVIQFRYEYPVAGDISTVIYSAYWKGDGVLTYQYERSVDKTGLIETTVKRYYDSGVLSRQYLIKSKLDQDSNWVHDLLMEYQYFNANGEVVDTWTNIPIYSDTGEFLGWSTNETPENSDEEGK